MKYVIKVDYTVRLEYTDYEEFTETIGKLINGGLKQMDIIIEEVEA